MRLYSFVNMYMEGIHAGIQTAHVASEISSKYRKLHLDERLMSSFAKTGPLGMKLAMFHEWETKYKVIQVYNGGYSFSLRHRYDVLHKYAEKFGLPLAKFHESKEALDGALTAVGIIVPERYYNFGLIKKSTQYPIVVTNGLGDAPHAVKTDEESFHDFIHSCKHAR